jgi:hypothetical protein
VGGGGVGVATEDAAAPSLSEQRASRGRQLTDIVRVNDHERVLVFNFAKTPLRAKTRLREKTPISHESMVVS